MEEDHELKVLKIKRVRSIASKYEIPERYKGRYNDSGD